MPLTLESSYPADVRTFLKGNLHAHTTESDGKCAPQEVVDNYAARGYDFLMISDHDKLTDPAKLNPQGMVLIPGNEVSAKGPHLLHINARTQIPPHEDRQKVLDEILEQKGVAVLNHPNWQSHFNHFPQEKLSTLKHYSGIEIYNGVIRRLEGSPLATDRWDMLLASGKRVWGFCNDDSHKQEDVELAWNMVCCQQRTPDAIVSALANGSFYGSTGVQIEHIAWRGRTIHLRAPGAFRIAAVINAGKRISHVDSAEITFHVPEDCSYDYVRFEVFGAGEAMAWTQPFFVKRS